MKIERTIPVSYKHTNDPKKAKQWLDSLPDLIAVDFETAVRYSKEDVLTAKRVATDFHLPKIVRVLAQAIANATPLGHPSHSIITHCSIAYSDRNAYVFIIDSQNIADVVLDFLVETEKVQVWHNYSYDGRFIRYYTYRDAKNIEDTQILAKTLINHVETFKARTGLKELAGAWYGDWGISSDNFIVDQQYDEKVLRYAATDACATFKLWEYLNDFIGQSNITK
jgi:hypothetical protein